MDSKEKEKIDIKFRPIRQYHMTQVVLLLNQLSESKVHNFDTQQAWHKFKANNSSNAVVGLIGNDVVAYRSIVIEHKIRGEVAGHIEDVVVDKHLRGSGVGIKLIEELLYIAEMEDCFRVSLFCKPELEPFYEKTGFKVNNIVMKKWLN